MDETRCALYGIVQIVVEDHDRDRVCTSLSQCFDQSLNSDKPGTLIDWQYYHLGAMTALPSPIEVPPEEYVEVCHAGFSFEDLPYTGSGWLRAHVATVELCMSIGNWDRKHQKTQMEDMVWGFDPVLYWKYLRLGKQYIQPQQVYIPVEEDYVEGDAFDPNKMTVF